MDIKEAANNEAAEQRSADTHATMGRRILAAGLSGAALSLVPWFAGRAGARPDTAPPGSDNGNGTAPFNTEDVTAGSVEATNGEVPATTASPRRPTPEDFELLGFAQTVELSVVALYKTALDANVFDTVQAQTFNTIRQAHLAYAQSLSGLLGRYSPNVRNEALYLALEGDFTGDATSVAAASATLENSLVATHVELVGELVGLDGSSLIASMIPIEARNATVFHTFAGAGSLDEQVAEDGDALSPDDYPVE